MPGTGRAVEQGAGRPARRLRRATWSWSAATCRCSTPATARRADRARTGRPRHPRPALGDPRRRHRLRPRRAHRRRRASTASSSRRTPPTTNWRSPRSTPAPTCSPPRALRDQLPRIGTDNAQGEKYLTDVVGLLRGDRRRVAAVPVGETVAGRRHQRPGAARRARRRALNRLIVRGWQRAGVTVQDPATHLDRPEGEARPRMSRSCPARSSRAPPWSDAAP